MSLTFERLYPWIFGAFAITLGWLLDLSLPFGDDTRFTSLLSASISVSAILVGFLATMKSILMAIPGVIERLRKANYLDILSTFLVEGTLANLLFCILNIAAFFPWVTTEKVPYLSAIWVGVGVFAALSFWRIVRVMILIMNINPSR